MKPLMYEECFKDCRYAIDMVSDEDLDIIANDILLLSEGYADDVMSVFLSNE